MYTSPDFNQGIDQMELSELIDIKFLQEYQDAFSESIGVAAITVDINGKPITKPSGFTDFCTKFTRGCAAGKQRCENCDRDGGAQAARTGKTAIYDCHAGLVDFATPIIINGKQVGSILGGQVLTKPVDEDRIRQVARDIGVDPDEYVAAANKINIVDRYKLESAAKMLSMISASLSNTGVSRLHLKNVSGFINEKITNVSASMEELSSTAANVSDNQEKLNKGILEVNEISAKIKEFTDMIKNIAKQTRLLGLNASIEAARAGAAGAGFSVVAEEIGKLAGSSSDTVDKIQDITNEITLAVEETVRMGEQTADIVRQQSEAIEKSTQDLVELAMSTSDLSSIANK
ncbi:MAG: PocR ligand-binding domain-containing protein [Selenomonadaceae bacterium]|nr:PocR ligand-binding domain-containing protein [Selenomonadaceae bacterium]